MSITRRHFLAASTAGAAALLAGCADTPPGQPPSSPSETPIESPSAPPLDAPEWVDVSAPIQMSTAGQLLWWSGTAVIPFAGRFWTMLGDMADATADPVEVTFSGINPDDPTDVVKGPTVTVAQGASLKLWLAYPDTGQFYLTSAKSSDRIDTCRGITVSPDGAKATSQTEVGVDSSVKNYGGDPSSLDKGYYSAGAWYPKKVLSVRGGKHTVARVESRPSLSMVVVDGHPVQFPGTIRRVLTFDEGVLIAVQQQQSNLKAQSLWVDWSGRIIARFHGSENDTLDNPVFTEDRRWLAVGGALVDTVKGKAYRLSNDGMALGFTKDAVFGEEKGSAWILPLDGVEAGETTPKPSSADLVMVAAHGDVAVLGADWATEWNAQAMQPRELYLAKVKPVA